MGRISILAFAALLLAPLVALHAAGAPKPNILLMVADDLGYGDIGCYGAAKIKNQAVAKLK